MPLSKITSNSISTAETFQSFSTGGVERLRIDSTGNVSIGTTSTAIKFNVYSSINPLVANFDTGSASGSYIRFQNSGTSIGDLGSGVNLFGGGGYALDFGLTSRTGGNLVFGTASTERMRISSSGNIGIGVVPSISARRLTVYGSSASAAVSSLVIQTSTSGTTASDGFSMELDGTTAYLWNYENAPLLFGTNNLERMRIDANGNIGIGTTSLPTKLNVNSGSDGGFARFTTSGTQGWIQLIANNDINKRVEVTVRDNGNYGSLWAGSDNLTWDRNGRIGVGTSLPNGRITSSNYNFNPSTNFSGTALTLYGSYAGGIALIDSSDPNSGIGYALWVDASGANFNIAKGATNSAATGGVYIINGATSWSARSDERDKLNLESIDNALSKVQTLRAVTGEYIWAEGIRHPFLIAQDVQSVLPEAVSIANQSAPQEEQRLGISYTDVIPLLVAAIKELKNEFDEYKATHP